jgi:hypothetical protein
MNYAWVGSITNLPVTQEDETAERSVTFGSGQRAAGSGRYRPIAAATG